MVKCYWKFPPVIVKCYGEALWRILLEGFSLVTVKCYGEVLLPSCTVKAHKVLKALRTLPSWKQQTMQHIHIQIVLT